MSRGGSQHGPEGVDGLDAYTDGLLGGPAREAFEARLAGDPALRDELAAQRRLDDSLRGLFCVPLAAPLLPTAPANGHASHPPSQGPSAPAAAAGKSVASKVAGFGAAGVGPVGTAIVLLALIGAGVWWYAGPRWRSTPIDTTLEDGYAALVAGGFAPKLAYRNERELVVTCQGTYGERLAFAALPPGVEILGLTDRCHLPFYGAAMLARVDGREVVVLAGPPFGNRQLTLPPGSKLRVFRRDIGPFVTWEVTPHDRPRVVELLSTPADAYTAPAPNYPPSPVATAFFTNSSATRPADVVADPPRPSPAAR